MIAVLPLLLAALMAGGEWNGTMVRDGDRLPVRFDLSQARPQQGTFSAPDLGAIDIPLHNVRLGADVHWDLVGDTTTTRFDGRVSGDTITGSFSENGRDGTFTLRRADASADLPYQKHDVKFYNGGVRLAGTMYVPRTPGMHPAVIFVHGSGDEGRWASAYLADNAARHGIVALTYDKRGVGESSGDWRTSTMDDLARDARAGIALLAQTAGVDRARIGVYGHSQGGEIAPAIAENNPLVSFVIDADGPVGPQYLQDIFRVDNFLAQKYSGEELADAERLYREFVDTARTGSSHEQLRSDIRAAGNAPWLADLAIPDDESWIWAWYARYGNYDNRSAWADVHVPVLILFGGKDALVPVKQSVAETRAILIQHGDTGVTVRIFGDADHTLHVPPKDSGAWPHLPSGFPDVIATFVESATRTAAH